MPAAIVIAQARVSHPTAKLCPVIAAPGTLEIGEHYAQ